MTTIGADRTAAIRQLNDALRISGAGGKVLMTAAMAALPTIEQAAVLTAVRTFAAFSADNDLSREHDCPVVQVGEHSIISIDVHPMAIVCSDEAPS